MSLTLDYMRGLVRSRLDDTSFEQTYLDQALREAQWDILRNRNFTFLEKTSTVVLTAATNTVPFPTDINSLIGVRLIATGILSYDISENFVNYADFKLGSPEPIPAQSTTPQSWTSFAGNVVFPYFADKNYTVTFDYVRSPTNPLVGTDIFDIPDEFQELLKIGAYIRIAKREDDYDVRDAELIDYQRLLQDLVHAYTRNPAPRNKRVMRTMRR